MNRVRRAFIRHPADVPIEISTERKITHGDRPLHNVSLGGLAFESAMCLDEGEVVRIRIPSVDPPFETLGRVSWCRAQGGGFEVGVQFLEEEDAFRARMVEQVCHIEDYRNRVREEEGRTLTGQEAASEWIRRYAAEFPNPAAPEAERR